MLCCRHWGLGAFSVSFVFPFGMSTEFHCVVSSCQSRVALAQLLWKFRAARRWWRSSAAPPRSLRPDLWNIPRYGLRWLAHFWCALIVEYPGHIRVYVVPPGRIRREGPGRFPRFNPFAEFIAEFNS